MYSDEITKGAEKILSGVSHVTEEITPVIQSILDRIRSNNEAFDLKKHEIEKDIDRGARTTKHRLHL